MPVAVHRKPSGSRLHPTATSWPIDLRGGDLEVLRGLPASRPVARGRPLGASFSVCADGARSGRQRTRADSEDGPRKTNTPGLAGVSEWS